MERYNKNVGDFGEECAKKYLEDNGYKILTQNYNCRFGEIDIIALDDNCLVFVEVKTRTNLKFGTPAMAVNFTKKKHIKSAAKTFLYLNRRYGDEVRFDVVEIFINNGKCEIEHIEGAM